MHTHDARMKFLTFSQELMMNKLLIRKFKPMLVVLFSSSTLFAETYVTLKDPECLTNVSPLFTTGGQYLDPNNGVLENSWSMLVRWQGNDFVQNSVSYDLSRFTRMDYANTGIFTPQAPPVGSISNWQRGIQPESANGTPGVQLYCNMMGMLVNTWGVPHREILGGGYNSMFGYSWSSSTAPEAFVMRNVFGSVIRETDLLVQADIAVPWLYTYKNPNNSATRNEPASQVSLFAYIVDISNPNLHPIALIGLTHDKLIGNLGNSEFVACDYANGVYFASSNPATSLNFFTRDPYSAYPQLMTDRDNANEPYQFFRMRVTPNNFRNIINAINSYGSGCPTAGYSTDISHYRIKYAGVIPELTIYDGRFGSLTTLSDFDKDQISIGVKAKDVGIYRRYD
jgi:hypothetical protein